MRVLVTGGAGYIGSHAVLALLEAGHEPVVFDNLSTGHEWAVPEGVVFIKGDILNPGDLAEAFRSGPYDCLMHFAAKIAVPESVADPELYYRQNVAGSLELFSAARRAAVGGVIFSSSAAVYGVPEKVPLEENAPVLPVNPYGRTKLMMERMLADFARAYGLGSISLRYFNAAGADPSGRTGEEHDPETHLIPNVLRAALSGAEVRIFGADYDTPDGTAIRDYIHVSDLAEAHVLALGGVEPGRAEAYNMGSGRGFSVREVVETARRVTGREIEAARAPRREGDPPRLVASSGRLRRDFGWKPRLGSLEEIIRTAWLWHSSR